MALASRRAARFFHLDVQYLIYRPTWRMACILHPRVFAWGIAGGRYRVIFSAVREPRRTRRREVGVNSEGAWP